MKHWYSAFKPAICELTFSAIAHRLKPIAHRPAPRFGIYNWALSWTCIVLLSIL